jgi:hypothetical protein
MSAWGVLFTKCRWIAGQTLPDAALAIVPQRLHEFGHITCRNHPNLRGVHSLIVVCKQRTQADDV